MFSKSTVKHHTQLQIDGNVFVPQQVPVPVDGGGSECQQGAVSVVEIYRCSICTLAYQFVPPPWNTTIPKCPIDILQNTLIYRYGKKITKKY